MPIPAIHRHRRGVDLCRAHGFQRLGIGKAQRVMALVRIADANGQAKAGHIENPLRAAQQFPAGVFRPFALRQGKAGDHAAGQDAVEKYLAAGLRADGIHGSHLGKLRAMAIPQVLGPPQAQGSDPKWRLHKG